MTAPDLPDVRLIQQLREELEHSEERREAYRRHARRWQSRARKNMNAIDALERRIRQYQGTYVHPLLNETLDQLIQYIHSMKGDLHDDQLETL